MPGKRIFIIDDEKEILDSLSRRLKNDGYEVLTASLGREAVQQVKDTLPDLLLVDIVLPDIDGPEVIVLIQEDAAAARIPVIFFSGIISREGQGYYSEIKAGGKVFPAISKPFPYNELVTLIQRYV